MSLIRTAIIGRGNVGLAAAEAVRLAPDMELAGFVRRADAPDDGSSVTDIRKLGKIDTAILCRPSRKVSEAAAEMSALGIHTVDSYDMHSTIWDYCETQDRICKANKTVSVIAAGWDPGLDSALRCLFEAAAPDGVSYTNFGPGLSMGHSVAARAVAGVKDACSITIPDGEGVHSRRVYIELCEGYEFDKVASEIKADGYFCHDKTEVLPVSDVNEIRSPTHGVLLERTGIASGIDGQRFSFDMRINNPAVTAQIMVACARAAAHLTPGCYTMADIPPALLLPGGRESVIKRLV